MMMMMMMVAVVVLAFNDDRRQPAGVAFSVILVKTDRTFTRHNRRGTYVAGIGRRFNETLMQQQLSRAGSQSFTSWIISAFYFIDV